MVYYYEQFVEMVNDALTTAYDTLVPLVEAIVPAIISLVDLTANPVIIYNSSTAIFSLVLQINNGNDHNAELQCVYDANNTIYAPHAYYVAINFNNYLFNYFNAFPSVRIENPAVPFQYSYQIGVKDTYSSRQPGNYFNEDVPPAGYVIFPSSYADLTSWQQLARIMFLTTIPVYPETVSNNLAQNYGVLLKQNLLTDYEVLPNQRSIREYLYFNNQGSFRYVDFACTGSLRVMNLSIYYMDDALNFRQIMMSPNQESYIKIGFRKKKWTIYKEIAEKFVDKIINGLRKVTHR